MVYMTFSLNTARNTPKTVAYLRVSTIDRDIEKNKAAILALANHKVLGHVQFVEGKRCPEKISWKKRKIAEILETAQRRQYYCKRIIAFRPEHA